MSPPTRRSGRGRAGRSDRRNSVAPPAPLRPGPQPRPRRRRARPTRCSPARRAGSARSPGSRGAARTWPRGIEHNAGNDQPGMGLNLPAPVAPDTDDQHRSESAEPLPQQKGAAQARRVRCCPSTLNLHSSGVPLVGSAGAQPHRGNRTPGPAGAAEAMKPGSRCGRGAPTPGERAGRAGSPAELIVGQKSCPSGGRIPPGSAETVGARR